MSTYTRICCATLLSMLSLSAVSQSPAQPKQTNSSDVGYMLQRLEVQVSVLSQKVDDLAHRVDLHRLQLDAIQPEVQSVKLFKLEEFMTSVESERAQRTASAKEDHDAMMTWFRGIGGGVLTAILLIGFNAWLAHVREGRRGAEMAVLTSHTNGMTEQISKLAEAKGHSDEKAGIGTL